MADPVDDRTEKRLQSKAPPHKKSRTLKGRSHNAKMAKRQSLLSCM